MSMKGLVGLLQRKVHISLINLAVAVQVQVAHHVSLDLLKVHCDVASVLPKLRQAPRTVRQSLEHSLCPPGLY